MFCQAITSRGTPCIASCKADSAYCHHHVGRCVECPVCFEEVPARRLPCGHRVCGECLYRIVSDSCPLCRHQGLERGSEALRWVVTHSYTEHEILPWYLDARASSDDPEIIRLALRDLSGMFYLVHTNSRFSCTSPQSEYYPEYVDMMRSLVYFFCRFHVIAFRDHGLLADLFDEETGLPYTDEYPCMRRFIRCLDSFRHRVGGLPDFDRSRSSSQWLDHLDRA